MPTNLQELEQKIMNNAVIMGQDLVPLLQLIQQGVNPPPFGGDFSAVLGVGDDAGGQNAVNLNDVTANAFKSAGAGLLVAETSVGSNIGFTAVTGAVTITSSAAGTNSQITMNATNNLILGGIGGTILTKNGTAVAVALGNAVTNGIMFGTNTVSIATSGVEKWMVNSSGALNPIAANTYDIGGSTTIRDIGVGRNVIVGGIISAAVGAVGAPSYAFTGRLTNGMYSASATQTGFAIGGVLVGGFDASGLFTGTISEQVGAAGVTIAGTGGLKTNLITDNGSDILIDQTTSGSSIDLTTLDTTIQIVSGSGVGVTAAINSNIALSTSGTGIIQSISDAGTIVLTPNTGWTACTGTENKAGLDANNVIFTAGALQDLARTVAALQNILITKGYLVA